MKKYNFYLILTVFLVITGCKVSKDIQTPKPDLPTAFRSTSNADMDVAIDTTTIADLSYRQFFPDANLQALIEKAITGNYDMQEAVQNIDAARLLVKQAKWNNVPQASLYINAGSTIPSENSLNGLSARNFLGTTHVEDYSAGLQLSWEADIWGKMKNRKREALAGYLITEEARKAVQTEIVAMVARGYYNILMLDAQLAIARKNLDLGNNTLRVIKLQFDAGQITSLAVEQSEAQRLRAAQIIPMLEKEVMIQENALSILIGGLPDAIERNPVLNMDSLHTELASGIPAAILSRRPDIKAAEFSLMAANARVGIAKSYMYPALNITAGGGLNSFQSTNWFNVPASLFGIVAGSIAQPLLDGKRLRTQYEIAKVDREKAVIAFRKSVLVGVGEVSDALVRVQKLKEEQDVASTRVASLQKATGDANKLFNNGMANYLEVINAQSNALQAELELATLKRDQLTAVAYLYRALGGGWK